MPLLRPVSSKWRLPPLLFALVCLLPLPPVCAAEIPVPHLLPALANTQNADAVLSALVGIPYRQDGGIDDAGNFTLLADPKKQFDTPGLNCSGLVLEASRFLLKKNFSIEDAVRDRLNDSGPASSLGQDWDFGWDLVLNLSDGLPRTLLLPGGESADPADFDGLAARGYDLHDPATWSELPDRIRPGYLYLASFNRETAQKGYTLLHYHVGILHRNHAGNIMITQTTGTSRKSYSRTISSREGLDLFLTSFANTGTVRKMVAIIEVPLP